MLLRILGLAVSLLLAWPAPPAAALDRLCDTAFENCRTPLRDLIRGEDKGIDVAFWFMTDTRFAGELIARWRAGVPVRVVVDPRAVQPGNDVILKRLREAGVPMRYKTSAGIVHWKMMLFAGQGVVQFSGANYSSQAFEPIDPFSNYVDEVIYFTSRTSIVNSFKKRFDDVWTGGGYGNYSNADKLPGRRYASFPIDSELNFVPWESFRSRSVAAYRAEQLGVDAIIYRITDRAHSDALIEAIGRGVRVRILTEQKQYREPNRMWHSWNVDRLYMAGAEVRHRRHLGLVHEKLTLLHSQRMSVFGSSNWTGPSATSQLEHNLFTKDALFYAWSVAHFDRKWYNLGPVPETQPFVPLPPDRPVLRHPADGATGQPGTMTFSWHGGLWAHKYDVYIGTDPGALYKVADDHELGPSETKDDLQRFAVSGLQPGATYYWYVVGRTMANMTRASAMRSFRVSASAPAGSRLPLGWSTRDIGSPGGSGGAEQDGSRVVVRGAGQDIWSASDHFRFAYRPLSGDGMIEARIGTVQGAGAKVGVMLREALGGDSKHVSLFLLEGQGLAFQHRTSTGGGSTAAAAGAGAWVRLERLGDTINAYTSADGSSWMQVESIHMPMKAVIYAGLAVTSRNGSQTATATFDRVNITTIRTPPPTPPDAQPLPDDPDDPDDPLSDDPEEDVAPSPEPRTAVPRQGAAPAPLGARRR